MIKTQSQKAFSLIEAATVIAVIVILTAALVPTIKKFIPTLQLSGSSKVMLGKLRQAQEEAIALQVIQAVRFNTGTNPITYTLVKKEDPEVILGNVEMPKGMTISFDPAPANNEISFSSDGGPNTATTIKLTLRSNTKTINISPAGVIKFQ